MPIIQIIFNWTRLLVQLFKLILDELGEIANRNKPLNGVTALLI